MRWVVAAALVVGCSGGSSAPDAGPRGRLCDGAADCPAPFSCVQFAGAAHSTCQLECEVHGDCGILPGPGLAECDWVELEDDPNGGFFCLGGGG